ncbi:MAG: alpha/beta hydrolase [Paracoccaceae bacterium]
MEKAPFFNDVAEGPANGAAFWIKACDGVRLRVAYWPGGDKGTILLYPGRTEFIEKYGRTAMELTGLGYHVLAIDWRGQGLADRMLDDPQLGHVGKFSDYQLDVAAMMSAADDLKCPRPRFLMAHSMGGCIALRALHEGLPVKAVAFSAPMWGMSVAPALRPIARPLVHTMAKLGRGTARAPGTDAETYLKNAPFEDNLLTSDADMYAYMKRQSDAHPEMTLSGPTINWVQQSFAETAALQGMSPPNYPAIAFIGSNERIVDSNITLDLMTRWKRGDIETVPGAEHEIIMEKPKTRAAFFAAADALFFNNSR